MLDAWEVRLYVIISSPHCAMQGQEGIIVSDGTLFTLVK